MSFGLYAHTHIREREVSVNGLCHRDVLHRVALMLVHALKSVIKFHVGVERVILGPFHLFRKAVIERSRYLGLVGEKLPEFQACGERQVALVVLRTLVDPLFQSAEPLRHITALQVHGTHIGELHIEVSVGSPTSRVVVFLQSQLIEPHFATLLFASQVPDTDDEGLHLSERGVTHNGNLVLRVALVISLVSPVV